MPSIDYGGLPAVSGQSVPIHNSSGTCFGIKTCSGQVIQVSGQVQIEQASGNIIQISVVSGGGTTVLPAGTVVTEQTYGQAPAVGIGLQYAREDHTHGTPTALGGNISGVGTSGNVAVFAGTNSIASDGGSYGPAVAGLGTSASQFLIGLGSVTAPGLAFANPSLRDTGLRGAVLSSGERLIVVVSGADTAVFDRSGLYMMSGRTITDCSGYTLPGSYALSGAGGGNVLGSGTVSYLPIWNDVSGTVTTNKIANSVITSITGALGLSGAAQTTIMAGLGIPHNYEVLRAYPGSLIVYKSGGGEYASFSDTSVSGGAVFALAGRSVQSSGAVFGGPVICPNLQVSGNYITNVVAGSGAIDVVVSGHVAQIIISGTGGGLTSGQILTLVSGCGYFPFSGTTMASGINLTSGNIVSIVSGMALPGPGVWQVSGWAQASGNYLVPLNISGMAHLSDISGQFTLSGTAMASGINLTSSQVNIIGSGAGLFQFSGAGGGFDGAGNAYATVGRTSGFTTAGYNIILPNFQYAPATSGVTVFLTSGTFVVNVSGVYRVAANVYVNNYEIGSYKAIGIWRSTSGQAINSGLLLPESWQIFLMNSGNVTPGFIEGITRAAPNDAFSVRNTSGSIATYLQGATIHKIGD